MITLLLGLALLGFLAWLLTTYVPMPEPVKRLIVVVVILVVILYLLQAFGLLGGYVAVPQVRFAR